MSAIVLDNGLWQLLFVAIVTLSTFCNASTFNQNPEEVAYERTHLRELTAMNRNHFGNFPAHGQQPVTILQNNTNFEQLECVGFNPQLSLLSATIQVKLPFGFGGDLCSNGSLEYVRFWVDYGLGSGFEGIGYVSVNTHDIKDSSDCKQDPTKPLFYTLSMGFDPKHDICANPVLPTIRATLSWRDFPPDDPNWSPIYGNSIDVHIQSLAESTATAIAYTSGIEVPPAVDGEEGFLKLSEGCHEAEKEEVSESSSNDANLQADTKWEELTCLGLDWSISSLVATVQVKQPTGYNASSCNNRSFEYVSFWADWSNTCNWTFIGTAKFNVHDYEARIFPPKGLTYTAIMPVNVLNFSTPCNETKIGRVRAALSYNSLPPTPPAVASRGNFIQTHVHLQPYNGTREPTTLPHIRAIGRILIPGIDTVASGTGMTLPDPLLAQFIGGSHADTSSPFNRPCPFGGLIIISGEPVIGHSYRVMARKYPPPDPNFEGNPVANRIVVTSVDPPPNRPVDPGPGGWFNYLPLLQNWENILAFWTPTTDGYWQIRVEMGTQGATHTHEAYTPWYKVLVNNKRPTPNSAHISLTGTDGALCGDLAVGTTVTGSFDAQSESPYFGFYSFELEPHILNPKPVPFIPLPGEHLTPVLPSQNWSLETTDLVPCGYVVTLRVVDRTVVGSNPSRRFRYYPQVGFCLRKPTPAFCLP